MVPEIMAQKCEFKFTLTRYLREKICHAEIICDSFSMVPTKNTVEHAVASFVVLFYRGATLSLNPRIAVAN